MVGYDSLCIISDQYDGLVYQFELDDLDWSPASPAMDIIRGHLGRQAKLDGWEELGLYCTFFAIYDGEYNQSSTSYMLSTW